MNIKGYVTLISYPRGIYYIVTDNYERGRRVLFRLNVTDDGLNQKMYDNRRKMVSLELENISYPEEENARRRFTVMYDAKLVKIINPDT